MKEGSARSSAAINLLLVQVNAHALLAQLVHELNQVTERTADAIDRPVVEIYSDNGISVTKRRGQRPAFDRIAKDAAQCKLDMSAPGSVE